jgi:hypothetical protein
MKSSFRKEKNVESNSGESNAEFVDENSNNLSHGGAPIPPVVSEKRMRGGSVELGPGLHRSLCCRSGCAQFPYSTRTYGCRYHLPASAVGRTDDEARSYCCHKASCSRKKAETEVRCLVAGRKIRLSTTPSRERGERMHPALERMRKRRCGVGGQQKGTLEHDSSVGVGHPSTAAG